MKEKMCPEIIIGIDPSYSACGLTIIDMYHKVIKTYVIETSLGKQDFYNICMKSKEQADKICDTICKYSDEKNILESLDTVVGMENALPYAFNSVALTALDVQLFHKLNEVRVALFNPTYLNYIMGKHTKKDSINLAKGLISVFEKYGYKHARQEEKNLTDGEAESLIYAVRMLCRTMPEDKVSKSILDLQPLFADKKEKYGKDFIY